MVWMIHTSLIIQLYINSSMKTFITLCILLLIISCSDPYSGDSGSDDLTEIELYWGPVEVVSYIQAPGSLANNETYSIADNINKLMGFPVGGSATAPDNSSIVSLGEAGGSVTLRFDPPISNITSYDFIVYGNPFLSGGDSSGSMEPAYVEVSEDNESWYLLVSDDNLTHVELEEISYSRGDYNDSYWPEGAEDSFILTTLNSLNSYESTSGFAEVTPTLGLTDSVNEEDFYTDPDIGGGDAFNLDWAVDEDLNRVSLSEISYVRITTAVHSNSMGVSTSEIDAVIRCAGE